MDAGDWDRRYESVELLWSGEPNRFVEEEVSDLGPGRALDVAAGEGRNAIWLAARGWRVRAVDFSSVALSRGRRLAEERGVDVDWVEADVEHFEPEVESWDLVLLAYLHLPWERMRPVLRAAARAVAPGGTLLLVGHDLANLERGHGGPQDPRVLYTPAMVAAELEGLDIEKAVRVPRAVVTDGGTATAVDVLVRARR